MSEMDAITPNGHITLGDFAMRITVIALLTVAHASAWAQEEPTAEAIQHLGLDARLDTGNRDAHVQALAGIIAQLAGADPARLHGLQRDVQEALLLVCDPPIFDTLSRETVEAVDHALEQVITLDEVSRSTRWEPLIYAYGFFNHDTSAEEIRRVWDVWVGMSDAERELAFPTYPHTIDAVCKPLSMGPLAPPADTREALAVALPALKALLLQVPAPGRAYHIPSHAALVLGPLHDRWAGTELAGDLIEQHLGNREEFAALLAGQLAGARPDRAELSEVEFGFYAYSGRYIANGLARFNERSIVLVLRASLEVYEARGGDATVLAYTRRALAALGDSTERAALESALENGDNNAIPTLVWLCRNGQGETLDYAERLLGMALGCPPDQTLATWFREQQAQR